MFARFDRHRHADENRHQGFPSAGECTVVGRVERIMSRNEAFINACYEKARPPIMASIAMIGGNKANGGLIVTAMPILLIVLVVPELSVWIMMQFVAI